MSELEQARDAAWAKVTATPEWQAREATRQVYEAAMQKLEDALQAKEDAWRKLEATQEYQAHKAAWKAYEDALQAEENND